ncbi:MAG: PAS domain S-box protein, partial [Desulfobacteraceae bacterium]|nr:PAS domain S-box protein [Desulfobacteraceae bacterium]
MSDRQQDPGHTFPDMAKLRKRAEEKAGNMEPPSLSVQTPEAIEQMVHKLRVHQIELEMQNEELGRAHAEIEASQARYFDLYDLAPVGYITVSEKGMILESNLTAVTLMGVSRSAMVKQRISRFILKEDQDIYYRHRENLFDTGEPQICEMRMVKPDGNVFWAHLSATAAEGPDGTTVCRVVLNDITERKQAEAEREKLQAQFTQAQKMESVGRLAGGVAHDFNNMLGIILGHTELALLKTDENNALVSDLNEIQKAAQRSANITKQLLAFARKDIISPKQIDLNDTVVSMLKMLRRLIGEDIDLAWQPGAHLWPVKMDPTQIDQILANLCVNARDAIEGVGKLTIETGKKTFDQEYCNDHPGFIPGDFVLLAVSDNGSGMDKDTLKNLFEPFFTTKEVGKGTGLGLATLYGIVKQNNGFINVYSEPGQGSTFKIY